MIKVQGRTLQISAKESFIGFENDNLVETRHFEITDESLFNFDFKLDMKHTGGVNIVDLPKEYKENSIILTWEVRKEHLPAGILYIQLRAFNDNEQVWHSEQKIFRVPESINATNYFLSPLPSEFEQMEQRVTQAKNETLTAADEVADNTGIVNANTQLVLQSKNIVENLAQEVATNTQQVSDDKNEIIGYKNEVANNTQIVLAKADIVNSQAQSVAENSGIVVGLTEQVSQDAEEVANNTQTVSENMQIAIDKAQEAAESAAAALQSEINAKTSEDNAKESETSALEAMQTAVQAMTDLLNMLGTDIATLVDGKIPVSQIPVEVRFDTVEISDESELTSLTPEQVQKGDVAEIIEGTGEDKIVVKSFKLLGDGNPANRENWVRIAVEYASISAYATTAGAAENANMINNKRLVAMTESQFEDAVKDPDTLYVVVPDEE